MKNIHYINAGAGSGKTYTLTKILAEKIINGNCKPGEVILTTFTELAASEFRERAQARLIENRRFDDATALGSAMMGTVHSIAYKFVTKYWYLLKRGVQTNVMDEGDKRFYINQSLSGLATPEQVSFFAGFRNEFDLKITAVSISSRDDDDFWFNHLRKIVDAIDTYNISDLRVSIVKSKESVYSIFNSKARLNEDRITAFLQNYTFFCSGQDSKTAQNTISAIETIGYNDYSYANISAISKLLEKPVGGKKAYTAIPDLENFNQYVSSLLRGQQYGDQICEYIDIIFGLADRWIDEFKEYKRRNKLIDFNDMELLFLQLLDNPIVHEDIRSNFKLVLVDEFQDSNPTQLRIFDKLSDLVGESIWVGDPKQAIYGFRGSDAELISAITAIFPQTKNKNEEGLSSETLPKSYRSCKELVEHANSVFVPAFSDSLREDQVRLEPNRTQEEYPGGSALHHWHSSAPNKDGYFQSLAQEVVGMLNGEHQIKHVFCKENKSIRNLKPEDIVILTRNNSDRKTIISALRDVGIKVSSPEDDFMDKAEVRLVEALLNYTLNPTDDLAKAEIMYLIDNASVETIVQNRMEYLNSDMTDSWRPWLIDTQLFKYIDLVVNRIKNQSVSSLVESLILELNLSDVIKKWGDYENRKINLDALLQMATQYEERCLQLGIGASLDGFIANLPGMTPDSSESHRPGMVSVLTYHKAKGLEWNVVILDSLYLDELDEKTVIQKSYFGIQTILLSAPCKENLYPERYISLVPWFLSSSKANLPADVTAEIVDSEIYKAIRKRLENECKRLLYVGLTRARDFVITTSYNSKTGKELKWIGNIGMMNYESPANHNGQSINIWGLGSESVYKNVDLAEEFEGIRSSMIYEKLIKQPNDNQFLKKYISPSALATNAADCQVEIVADFGSRIPLEGSGSNITDIGICIHNIFCVYSPDKADNQAIADNIVRANGLNGVIVDINSVLRSIQNLYDYLTAQYGKPVVVHLEYPFINARGGQIVRGSIDMVWKTEQGCVIVDYKSFPGKRDNITDPSDKHYAGNYAAQLAEYVNVIQVAGETVLDALVFYPVQGRIVKMLIF
ncbi:UvrD-helicase domain-containing protein [Bacteroidales bacterium OttesenSCG-928-A17]|nr:UvrD-helicase domain-containing protein [Bacteroidales bacterium OttesenSCG-928-A17]